MISYEYELFKLAKTEFNNAAASLSLIGSVTSKLQSSPLPKAISSSTVSGIVSACNAIKDNEANIKSTFQIFNDAIEELGLAEDEYNRALEELKNVEDDIWEFTTTPTSGRPTVEDAEKMREEIADLNERKAELQAEVDELAKALGIETVEEKKWYEVLGETITQFYDDEKEIADSYKNIFTNETSGGLISNITDYFETLDEVRKRRKSTNQLTESNIYRGIGNFFEGIGDFATQLFGAYAAMESGKLGGFDGADEAYEVIGNKIKEDTKALVTQDTVDTWYRDYYNTERGKTINDYSYFKYDDALADAISDGTEAVVETGAILALSPVAGPTGPVLAAVLEGASAGGDAVNKAYDNGATFDEATLYAELMAAVYGGTSYLGSDYFANIISKNGAFIPTSSIDDALKVTLGYTPGLKQVIKRVTTGTLVPTAIPMVDSLSEWATWGSEYHDLKDLEAIWGKNNTTENAALMALTGFGLTSGGELAGSLLQGKYLKNSFKEMYPNLSSEQIDNVLKNVDYVKMDDFDEMYRKQFPFDPTRYDTPAELAAAKKSYEDGISLCGGYANFKSGDIVLNLDTKGFHNTDQLIENVYHEGTHTIGSLNRAALPNGNQAGNATNEMITDYLAQVASGRESNGYNQKAIGLLGQFQGIVDPGNKALSLTYSERNFQSWLESINNYTNDPAMSNQILNDLSSGFQNANFNDVVGVPGNVVNQIREAGISQIEDILTELYGMAP